MRYRKTDFNFPFAPSVLRPCVIDFLTATMMLQALAAAFALFMPVSVTCALANLGSDLFPVFRIGSLFADCRFLHHYCFLDFGYYFFGFRNFCNF